MKNLSRQTLRQSVRQRRQALTNKEQNQASLQLLERFKLWQSKHNALRVALYLSNDGEVSTQPIIDWLWQKRIDVYLPVLHPFSPGHLLFLRYSPSTVMQANKYGIAEPKLDCRLILPAARLDAIFTPLVAFDDKGQRLGMGGGYYDRTLEAWHTSKRGPTPIGLAHDCQQVADIPSEAWDVPLPCIMTPSKTWDW